MNTWAVVVGVGESVWSSAAHRIAARITRLNPEVQARAITTRDELPNVQFRHISWSRLWIWDMVPRNCERVIWIDADCVPLRAFPMIPVAPFAAVTQDARGHANIFDFPILAVWKKRFNAGVFVATRASMPAFELAQQMMRYVRTVSCWEQYWLNLAVWSTLPDKSFEELPSTWNWKPRDGSIPADVLIVHAAGGAALEKERHLEQFWNLAETLDAGH